ncbi:helix-turn-helix domain-containing protein [Patescibacteria group bacterium]|nr:helix-turn-helix domain-containing protein [Patescibacteria group bacterium]
MNIGQRIYKIRQQKNITQEQLAKDLAISRQAVSKWESGKAIPDIENLMYISSLYDVSLDELIKGDNKVGQKIIADASAKKWHKLSILFFATLLVYIMWFGSAHGIWQLGLGIATLSMIIIDTRILLRNRVSKPLKRQ